MYKAKIIADSKNPQNDRLTTFVVQFPRIVLAEFNTHRMFSRNSASSRAIPFKKMVKMVEENPFIPIAWQKDHKGMQGVEYLDVPMMIEKSELHWLKARDAAIQQATILNNFIKKSDKNITGVTKQLCNRLLEPFMWHKVIITSGEKGLQNFFNLRCPNYLGPGPGFHTRYKSKKDYLKDWDVYLNIQGEDIEREPNIIDWLKINHSQADIHIQYIAELMWDSYNESKPKQLEAGEWHIPFGDKLDGIRLAGLIMKKENIELKDFTKELDEKYLVKIATARCARVSYNNFEGKDDYEADIKLYDRLAKSEHWSPFEHCARAMSDHEYNTWVKGKGMDYDSQSSYSEISFDDENKNTRGWCRNFKGFIPHRVDLDS